MTGVMDSGADVWPSAGTVESTHRPTVRVPSEMEEPSMATDWRSLTAEAALASHTLIGWIFWDPEAIDRYAALGVPDGLGYYVASRAAPIAAAGNDVVAAAFGSINPVFIQVALDLCRAHTTFEATTAVRDEAVVAGLRTYAAEACEPLAALAEPLWDAVDTLPLEARSFFAAHLDHRRTDEPLLSSWLAVNAMREWRGDTHWALHVCEGIDGTMAGLLDAGWRGHDDEWLPRSRGADDAAIAAATAALEARGLFSAGRINRAGVEVRQSIEDRLDDLCAPGWQALGEERTRALLDLTEPVAGALIARIDATAGERWMPAARPRKRWD